AEAGAARWCIGAAGGGDAGAGRTKRSAGGPVILVVKGENFWGGGVWGGVGGGDRGRHENWLLIKGRDDEARSGSQGDILEKQPLSVASGRSMDDIAAGKGKKRVWHSNRGADRSVTETRRQTQREFRAELQAQSRSRLKTSDGGSAKRTARKKTNAKAAKPVGGE